MSYSTAQIWMIIAGLGIGTYVIRFSFLGLLGQRPLPHWVMQHLRYTAVAVIPGMVAPLVLWPDATGGTLDPARLLAAAATFGIAYFTRNVVAAVVGGGATLWIALVLLG